MPAPANGATGALIIPNDVIFEILSRSPVKSVCRFQSVCRGWRALISDPIFVAAHEFRAEPHLLLIANSSNKERSRQGRDLRLMDMHSNVVRVIKDVGIYSAFCPSFDDAICVTFDDRGNTNVVDLANGKVMVTQTWGFAIRSCSFGFGRAIPSGTYKVVRFIIHADNSQQTCEVHTLGEDNGWRRTESHAPTPVRGRFATTVNGVLHYLHRLVDGASALLRFDLESEEWKEAIKGPLDLVNDKWSMITQLNGTLCLTGSQSRVHAQTHISIWLMTDYDKEIWTKTYTISTSLDIVNMIPLRVIRGKLLVCYYRNYGMETALEIYDPCTETFTFVMEMPYTTVGVVGICSLHLKGFWLP